MKIVLLLSLWSLASANSIFRPPSVKSASSMYMPSKVKSASSIDLLPKDKSVSSIYIPPKVKSVSSLDLTPKVKSATENEEEFIVIVRDEREFGDDGSFSVNYETANGIVETRDGTASGEQQGTISFTFPNGEEFSMKFVAGEKGFLPESSHLPIAPEFPHPIPQFVLDQIEFAAKEDAEKVATEHAKTVALKTVREEEENVEYKSQKEKHHLVEAGETFTDEHSEVVEKSDHSEVVDSHVEEKNSHIVLEKSAHIVEDENAHIVQENGQHNYK